MALELNTLGLDIETALDSRLAHVDWRLDINGIVSGIDAAFGHQDWKVDRSIQDGVGSDTHSVTGAYTPNCTDGAYRNVALSAEMTVLNPPTGLVAEAKVCTLVVTASGGNQDITALDAGIAFGGTLPLTITNGQTILLFLINTGNGWILTGGSVTSTEIIDSTAAGRDLLTALDVAAQQTILNVEDGATNNELDLRIYSSGSWNLVNGTVVSVEGAVSGLNLPLIGGVKQRILVTNRHTAAVTVTAAGSDDVLNKDGTTTTSVNIPAAQSIGFFADGATGTWRTA